MRAPHPAAADVVVVGAGPTGLMLASELALRGVGVTVLERRAGRSAESRALGLHGRTLDVLDQRGLAQEFLALGHRVPQVRLSFPGGRNGLLDLGGLDTRHGHLLILAQSETERILEQRAVSLGVTVRRRAEVSTIDPRDDGARVHFSTDDGPQHLDAGWVVGCDGSHSKVRPAMGATFVGEPYPYTILVADVRLRQAPRDDLLIEVAKHGLVVCTAFGNGYYRLGIIDRTRTWKDGELDLAEVSESLLNVFGRDLGPHDPIWTTRFRIQEKQSTHYRVGRLLLAGDAAHVHSPLGGQGLNLGVQDAFNLGWKLAAVQRGQSTEALLDTYVAERLARSEGVIKVTDIATRLMMNRNPVVQRARRAVIPAILRSARAQQVVGGALSGVGLNYTDTVAHAPGAGVPVPDMTLQDRDGRSRLFENLHDGRWTVVDPRDGAEPSSWGTGSWGTGSWGTGSAGTGVKVLRARVVSHQDWAAEPFLIRPDGYCGGRGVDGVLAGLAGWSTMDQHPEPVHERVAAPVSGSAGR